MEWIVIGLLSGSLVTSAHPNRETCEGRAVILREQKATVQCVELNKILQSYNLTTIGGVNGIQLYSK